MPERNGPRPTRRDRRRWRQKQRRSRRRLYAVGAVCLAAAAAGALWLARSQSLRRGATVTTAPTRAASTVTPPAETALSAVSTPPGTEAAPAILPELKAAYERNPDMVGWIRIDGTAVDYPVMYTPGKDDYLYRDFDKQESKQGCIFIDKHATLEPRDTNLLFHGHNMKDGSMFRTLLEYKKESYWKEHPIIHFDTLYERGEYEIVSVLLSKVYKTSDKVFKYYQFYNAESEAEFDAYIANVKAMALYDTGVEAQYGDELITLSTCEYSTENGRIAIVARKIAE
jgi:sortase B